MPKMLVLTDSETATGYRLAGVEVYESVPDEAQGALEQTGPAFRPRRHTRED